MKSKNNVDTTETTSCLEWCAGYGGIHLGLKRAIPSLRVIAYGEIESFACANLVAKMEAGLLDAAPIWTDIKTFPCELFRDRVDILVAGYPCQPFSAAGKRLGAEDPRHLWPHIARAIRVIRPRLCYFENVEGHISLGLSTVISDLEELGYKVSWGIFSASEVGAPHQRKRVFILAYKQCEGLEGAARKGIQGDFCGLAFDGDDAWPSRPGEPQHAWEPPRVVANSERSRGEEPEHQHTNLSSEPSGGNAEAMGNASQREDHGREPKDMGLAPSQGGSSNDAVDGTSEDGGLADSLQCGSDWRADRISGRFGEPSQNEADNGRRDECEVESPLGGNLDGTSCGLGYAELCVTCDNRTDELRLLGNGVVPATAERAFRVLIEELNK